LAAVVISGPPLLFSFVIEYLEVLLMILANLTPVRHLNFAGVEMIAVDENALLGTEKRSNNTMAGEMKWRNVIFTLRTHL